MLITRLVFFFKEKRKRKAPRVPTPFLEKNFPSFFFSNQDHAPHVSFYLLRFVFPFRFLFVHAFTIRGRTIDIYIFCYHIANEFRSLVYKRSFKSRDRFFFLSLWRLWQTFWRYLYVNDVPRFGFYRIMDWVCCDYIAD